MVNFTYETGVNASEDATMYKPFCEYLIKQKYHKLSEIRILMGAFESLAWASQGEHDTAEKQARAVCGAKEIYGNKIEPHVESIIFIAGSEIFRCEVERRPPRIFITNMNYESMIKEGIQKLISHIKRWAKKLGVSEQEIKDLYDEKHKEYLDRIDMKAMKEYYRNQQYNKDF